MFEPPDQEKVARNRLHRGFSCGLWTDPAGRRWEDFVHNTDEVVMVVDGAVEFEVGGRVYHPKPGEELFILFGCRALRTQYWTHDRPLAVRISAMTVFQICQPS